MKKNVFAFAVLACCLAVALTACSSGQESSSAAAPSSSSAPQSQSAASSSRAPVKDVIPEDESVSSSASASSGSTVATQQTFISLPVNNGTVTALLVLDAPKDWHYDNYVTFTDSDGIKVAEAAGIWKIPSGGVPFDPSIIEPYEKHEGDYPEGYGYQDMEELTLQNQDGSDSQVRIYTYKTWPDDADHAWYPRYTFTQVGDYLVQINFYTFDEDIDDALYRQILSSLEVFFHKDDESAAASEPAAPSSGSDASASASVGQPA